MTTIGDVLMVFGGVAAFGFGAWCLVLVLNLLFPTVASRASVLFERKAGGQLALGAITGLPLILIGLVMFGNPLPLLKILGLIELMGVLMIAGIGFSGLSRLCGSRVKGFGGSANEYQSLTKGTAVLVGACLFPLFGWFLLAPVCLVACIGCGFTALRRPVAPPIGVTETL